MNEKQDTPSKIIIDEDWKSQVDAERESIKQQTEKPEPAEGPSAGDQPLPPASLAFLVTTLATQAMATLGQIPDPEKGEPLVQLDHAKHFIETLAMLEEKTKGNLTHEEAAMMENVLHQLRMLYVAVQSHSAEPTSEPDK